ncbi:RHS repeat domain-containing protein, partial [Desulfofustis glycolicus]
VMTERFVKTETGFERIDWTYHSYNAKGRLIETLHANHTRTETGWSCCGKADSTDATGITSRYGYDDLGRNTSVFNEATGLHTEFTYDAAGRRLSTTERTGELTRTTAARYDLSGRLLATTDPAGLVTTFFHTATETALLRPGGAEEITRTHHDGSLRSQNGSGLIDRFYRYGVNQDGSRWTTAYLGTDNGPRWETTTRDLLGRIISSEKPGSAGPIVTTSAYDDRNRLISTATTGMVAIITDYDELNQPIMTGLDVDGNGRLEPASSDRIEERHSGFVKSDGAWWQQERQLVYPETGSDRPTLVSTSLSRLSGWDGSLVAERIVIDSHGARTVFRETLERVRRRRSKTVLYPDSIIPEEHRMVNGLPVAATTRTGRTTTYRYDGLGRRIAVTDPRTGTTRSGYDEHHRLAFVEDGAGNRTSYAYDPQTGLKISETNADNKKTRFSYTPLGQLERRWGDAVYPVQYAYNDYGEQVALTTFRTEQGWDRPDWPEDATGDKTSWQYQESTGLLLATYDATGTGPRYTYDNAGRLQTRTWARGVVTRYGYLSTGELSSIEYSDATPSIRFSYDRLGRKKTVSDVLGTRSYDYDDDHLQLIGEQQQHGPVVATIKRRYDHLGRPAGISLDDEYAVDYRYDQTGRFAALDWTGNRHRGTTTYDYLAGSDLLAGYRSGTITVSYAYEAQRDLKTAVTNTSHDRELSRYEYHYDRLGRQINVATTGSAFTKPTFALYGYNDRNELTTAARYAGDDLTDQGVPLPERERFYDYDPIGNRTKALEGRNRYDYQTNPLNQYETITAPPDPSQPLELFYDQDGNLTEMKTAVAGTRYVFNGENRLIIVEPTRPQPGDSKLRFSYDYRGRRVLQTVSSFTNGAWHQTARTGFIYDDWNLIAELNLDDDRAVQYVWGLDLSTTLQGAGGIGGLLVRVADDDQQHYLYDANGNVGQLVDEAGTLVAAYEYDAYGNQVQIAGSNAAENPFRFSTKYYDALSGLYYYGYRFYSAELGRWISRDPLEEKGGLNYYSFLRNNSINDFDLLGYLGFFQGLWQGVVDLGGGIGHTGEVLYLGTKALFGSEGAWKELGQIQEDREAIVRLVYETFDGKDSVFEAHFKSIISEVLDHVPDCAKQCLLEQLISELEIAFVGRQTGNIGVNIIVQKVSQTIGSKAGGIFTSKIGAIRKVGGSLVLGATILGYQTLGIMDAMSDSARELNDKYPGGYERLRRNGNTQYF